MSFQSEYRDLLIKQYWQQPKATAEINLKSAGWENVFNWLDSFPKQFDIDLATGERLDIIGRIVGLPRVVPLVIDKIAFGFAENPNARGFNDKFSGPLTETAPFLDKFEQPYTALQLNDNDYRFFIKAKVARNAGSGFMVSDNKISIQDVINATFGGNAFVIDKQDMRLVLNVSPVFRIEILRAIKQLGLLPKPQGVRYDIVTQTAPDETFGFADNIRSLGFANKFDLANEPGGRFAERILI